MSAPSPREARNRRSRRVVLALVGAAVGVALFVAVVYLAGPEQVGVVLEADAVWVVVAALAGVGVTLLSAYRWGFITNALVERRVLRWPEYYAAQVTSRVVGLFTPRNVAFLGIRFVALVGPGKTRAEFAAASVALDQMYDVVLIGIWLIPSLLLLDTIPTPWALVLLPASLAVAVALMMQLSPVLGWAARLLARLAERLGGEGNVRAFFERRAVGLRQLAAMEHFPRSVSLRIAAVTLMRYVINAVMFWAIASALGLGVGFWTFLLAGAVIQLSLVVAFTPGGLGLMDLGWVGVFTLSGYPSEAAAAFIVGQRAFQYTFFPLLAGASYAVLVATGGGLQTSSAAASVAETVEPTAPETSTPSE